MAENGPRCILTADLTSDGVCMDQANFSEIDSLNQTNDVKNGVDTTLSSSNLKADHDRLEAWEGWHEKSNVSQKIVVQNNLSFDHLQLKAWPQQTLSDDFGTQLRFLEVHPGGGISPARRQD